MPRKSSEPSSRIVVSVARALSILNSLGAESKGISTISKELQLSKGTIFDLVKTLECMGYVAQNPEDDQYRLGPTLLKLATLRLSHNSLTRVARPFLQALADDIGEVVHLGQREGMSAAFLDRAVSRSVTRMLHLNSQVGALSPLHCTSMGKVLLAYMGEAGLDELFAHRTALRAYTPKTLVDVASLRAELERIRAQGYALNLGEFEAGVSSIAVPIRNMQGEVIAGLNTAMPSVRMQDSSIPEFVDKLSRTARQIEDETGVA